ncbi:bifunctional hydroxymethylpyrimidine kinase/phosphomethylpyrimidine kinase [Alcaligenaceae bacterium CGII-47]|nr:bifunctional hydroxymethylpyrimidine kinase/phosphomethylpyrimidine kinase [Alcaligenaceae bacterium CGII-47]
MVDAVQTPYPPLPLIFGPFDPSGASNLPIDAVICAELGAHALCVITAIHVQDSAGLESIQRVNAELIDDQARCLLEDMPVGAIKVGPLYDLETISMLAQIAADYTEIPLVLHLSAPPDIGDLEELDAEETVSALLELLLPQADVVIVERSLLDRWHGAGTLTTSNTDDPVQALHEYGVPYVLCSNVAISSGMNGVVLYAKSGPGARWNWPIPQVRISDSDGMLADAVVTLLAQGQVIPEAIRHAVIQATSMLKHHFHPGMGQRMLLHTRQS